MRALINASRKWLKTFLALGVRKLGSPVALIFGTHVKFLNKFMTVQLALPPTSTTLSLSTLNAFGTKFYDPVAFNSKVNGAAILLKP